MKNNIYKRGKSWYVRFRVGEKRYNLSLGNDFDKACIKAPLIIAEKRGVKEGSHSQNVTWHSFKGKFFDWAKPPRYKQNTYYRYQLAFKGLEDKFPLIREMEDVTPTLLESFQTFLLESNYTNANTNKLIGCIKTAMRKAEEWGYVKPQVWKRVKKLSEPIGKVEWFTPEECGLILKQCKGPLLTGALLMIRAGLRISEIFYLPWEHVDLKNERIQIRAYGDWYPKKRKNRTVDIPADLVKHLVPMQRASGRVLEWDYKKPEYLSHIYEDIIAKAGLKGFPHKFRHTYASHLLNNGASLFEVAKLLGHTTTRTTEIYGHISSENVRNAVLKLPKILVPV